MENLKKFIPYIVIMAILHYVVLIIPSVFTQIVDMPVVSIIIFLLEPVICILLALIFGIKYGMSFVYIALIFLVYVPQIIYYRSVSVIILSVIYLLFSFIGIYMGSTLKAVKENKQKR